MRPPAFLRRALVLLPLAVPALAPASLTVPSLSSRPGAAYTLYLNFAGFSFPGTWGDTGLSPGITPAYSLDTDTASFSAPELANVREVWARVAEKYVLFDINVTTVDPAVAAGRAASDADRQAFYDASPRFMHAVIGGSGTWFSSTSSGVSYTNVAAAPQNPVSRSKTNFAFASRRPEDTRFVAELTAHELGHSFGLLHQGDWFGSYANDYSSNDNSRGPSSFAPVMGNSYSAQRGLWRQGRINPVNFQNDLRQIATNPGLSLLDSGLSHSPANANDLPLSPDRSTDPVRAAGFITLIPNRVGNLIPLGESNYTRDYFRLFSVGQPFSLTLHAGAQRLTPGLPDPGATFDGLFRLYNAAGTLVASSARAFDTLSYSLTATLPPGNYTVEVASVGGYQSVFDPNARYFTSGSYFLTGSSLYTRSTLHAAPLARTDLTAQDLSSSVLTAADLRSANLTSASLTSANLTSADLSAATLTHANLTHATLASADLRAADLTSANFTDADLTLADLTLADLRAATGFSPDSSTRLVSTLLPDGSLPAGTLALTPHQRLTLRPSPIPVSVATLLALDPLSSLEFVLDPSLSTRLICPPDTTLAGTLLLTLPDALDPASLLSLPLDLFDVPPSSPLTTRFDLISTNLPAPYFWDTSFLYTAGHVTLSIPEPTTALVTLLPLALLVLGRR